MNPTKCELSGINFEITTEKRENRYVASLLCKDCERKDLWTGDVGGALVEKFAIYGAMELCSRHCERYHAKQVKSHIESRTS